MDVVWMKGIVAAVGAGLTYVYGGWNTVLIVLVCFMVADYLSGVIAAVIQGRVSSAVGFVGLLRKTLILTAVGVGCLLDRLFGLDAATIGLALCWWFIANEGISFLENMDRAGVNFPEWMREMFLTMREKKEGLR